MADRPVLSEIEAITLLAKHLYFTDERLDPSGSPVWDDLTEREQEHYRICVREVLSRRTLINALIPGLPQTGAD